MSEDIAVKVLAELNISPIEIKRFTNGYCHKVYYVKTESSECVLRITSESNKAYYTGGVKWLEMLAVFEIPVPKILKHGQSDDVYFTLLSFINGKDLGDVYSSLSEIQKRGIVKDLSSIQRTVSKLPSTGLYGYPHSEGGISFETWSEYLQSLINRSRKRIKVNEIFDVEVCDNVDAIMVTLKEYFANVRPTAFLDDISTKNVLVNDGKLAGIVDVDEICFGDPLLIIGLTNMALRGVKADTTYIDYWLDSMNADDVQRRCVTFYTLLFCVDFMGEQGMRFDNGKEIPADKEVLETLQFNYDDLVRKLNHRL
ncbi:MAG: phosphotransferase [Oscillospiraceae bacterium]|nr:phosphotransferase [Oscillospiraceae bacterium]